MFRDDFDDLLAEVEKLLEIHSLEDLLELCDTSPQEAIALLVYEGLIELPEVKPVA